MTKLERLEKEFKAAVVVATEAFFTEAGCKVEDTSWATAYDKWQEELKSIEND
tara:strand:+ start:259 stop:417 length:159 start_codon:yes stop_codon:yes gene_type:complete